MVDGWHVGKPEILVIMSRQFKVYSWMTVKRWRKNGFPIRYLSNGVPYIIEKEAIKYQLRQK